MENELNTQNQESELKELRKQVKKLKRENDRLKIEADMVRDLNEQIAKTQNYIQQENQRQVCYNDQLLRSAPYMLVMTDEKLVTIMASDVFCRYASKTKDEIKNGLNLDEACKKIMDTDKLEAFIFQCGKCIDEKKDVSYLLNTCLEGEEKKLRLEISYYMDSTEEIKGLNILFTDLTDMVEAMERAENADKAKSNFLANMSHEIRTPMNAINGMAEFILRDSEDEVAKENAAMIKTSANALIAIINDILDFSKIESGKMEIKNEIFSSSSMINDVAAMIRIRLEDKNVDLKMDVSEKIPNMLIGDEVRVKQILINLLNNAVKFTHKGSITFSMKHEKLSEDSCRLYVSIKDTGIGIKEEDLSNIFDSFTQVDTRKNRSIEGTGLGLAICRLLTGMMGGELKVESEYGVGSTFSFTIICGVNDWTGIGKLGSNIQNSTVKAFASSFTAPSARILIVDDNDMNLKVARGILKPYKINPDCVSSGAEAIVFADKNYYDIIFMDHMMPVMDGVEAMQRIRKTDGGKDKVIIALTANAISGSAEHYKEIGFDGFLAKPIELKEMDAILREWLPSGCINETALQEDNTAADNTSSTEKMIKTQTKEPEVMEFTPDDDTDIEVMEFTPDDDADIEVMEFTPDDDADIEVMEFFPDEDEEKTDINIGSIKDSCPELNISKAMGYCMDDWNLYRELLEEYAFKNKQELLNNAYAEKDWNDYAVYVHALKSTSRTIGASDLGDLAAEMEAAAKEGREDFLYENHDAMMKTYDSLVNRIKGLFGN